MWDGKSPVILFGQGSGSDVYFRLGFCASYIRFCALADSEDVSEWCLLLGNADVMEQKDTDGVRSLDGSEGISLVAFTASLADYLDGTASAPSDVEVAKWYEANGIRIDTATLGLADGIPFMIEAWPLGQSFIRAVHDGTTSSNTYFEDSSVDFEKAGVEGGGTWIMINENNDNYCYVKEVQRPSGKTRKCRLLSATDAGGTATTAADFDTDDVVFIIPLDQVQYPLSGIGLMT